MARLRPTPLSFVLAGLALLAAVVLLAATVPSDDYLFVPDTAKPVAPKVMVQGGREPANGGGIYFVDVSLRQARWLERLLPFLRPDGATLVPQQAVTAPGQTFAERHQEALQEMDRSERVAAAVALKAAGLPVKTTPTGVRVEAVAIDVPALKQLRPGDLIVGARGRTVRTVAQLRAATASLRPGGSVVLRLHRGGDTIDRTVETVRSPREPSRAIIGIQVSDDAAITLPRKVNIDLGDIGGPSAGLPFALQVYQELGNDVDRGLRVAATGEIALDGSVEQVGGLEQKTIGARRAGADVFLVPAGDNAATARRYAAGLRVIPVESFRQALHALQTLPKK
ncbi:MAG TPA: S16 family serine protease [Gaiella sp.]|nr:S16 family serine protease [Gaiella sp.]